ncbi:MAG: substrate-binding domain-containing protein, partial [Actinobacteria bacterium]|nr:substrate-binding domain-containing protein [Actinomycetota bacterium]
VTLERISNKSKLPMVCYDTYKMMKSVIRHLIENNYKNPSLIVGSTNYLYNAIERVEAFKKALNEYNLEFKEDNILADEKINYFDTTASVKLISNLIKKNKPDSLLISKDILAIIIMYKLIREGYKIPEDIGIVGFDNIEISRYIKPSLTCIDIPIFKFGSEASKLLIKLVEKEKVDNLVIEFEPELVARESTLRLYSN